MTASRIGLIISQLTLFPANSGLATLLSLRSFVASESAFRPSLCGKAKSHFGCHASSAEPS